VKEIPKKKKNASDNLISIKNTQEVAKQKSQKLQARQPNRSWRVDEVYTKIKGK